MTTTLTQFSLRSLVDGLLDKHRGMAPVLIADKVMQELQDADADTLRDALSTTINGYVSNRVSSRRGVAITEAHNPPVEQKSTGSAVSAKVKGIRDWYAKLLDESLHIGPTATDYKRIGDCTHADLMFAVTERNNHIMAVQVQADRYLKLAELLAKQPKKTVGQLSRDAVETALL